MTWVKLFNFVSSTTLLYLFLFFYFFFTYFCFFRGNPSTVFPATSQVIYGRGWKLITGLTESDKSAVNARNHGWELSALIGCDRHNGPFARLHAPSDPLPTERKKEKKPWIGQIHFHNPAPAAEVVSNSWLANVGFTAQFLSWCPHIPSGPWYN